MRNMTNTSPKIVPLGFGEESLTHYRPAMPFGKRKKNILEDLFSSVLSLFKKYHPTENLTFNNLGIFLCLKLRNLMGKILRISFKLNYSSNTLGCYGLKHEVFNSFFKLHSI